MRRYPEAGLAKIYLATCVDEITRQKTADDSMREARPSLDSDVTGQDEADERMSKALALPDAEKRAFAWGQIHPEFCPLLVEFADARIVRADDLANSYDQDEPMRDERRDRELRKSSYTLARDVLELAAMLDPDSLKIQRLLAKTEELFGKYDAGHDASAA